MSRSYKQTPYIGQKQHRKDKRRANKAVRKNWEISNGGGFKKVYCSYDIRDYGQPLFGRISDYGEQRLHKWTMK